MSSKVLLPSLSEDGWVNNSIKVADAILSHFFESDRSQSYFYRENVSSMAWIIQDNQGNISKTISVLQQTLMDYFTRYFNNVIAEVTEVTSATNTLDAQLSIYLKFTDTENNDYVLARIIDIVDSKISKIISINNGD